MKNDLSQTRQLFRDRPLPETPARHTRRVASLDLSGLDRTDYVDSALRVFLVVCTLVSLAVCGREWSAPVASRTAAQPAATPCVLVKAATPAADRVL